MRRNFEVEQLPIVFVQPTPSYSHLTHLNLETVHPHE